MTTAAFGLFLDGPIEVLVNETPDADAVPSPSYASAAGNTSFIKTAEANLPYPKLADAVALWWLVTGQCIHSNGTPQSQTYNIQILVDGASVAAPLTFTVGGSDGTTGGIFIDLKILNIAAPTTFPVQPEQQSQMIVCTLSTTGTGGHISTETKCSYMGVRTGPNQNHKIALNVQKTVSLANDFLGLTSQLCLRIGGRSGS